MKNLRIFISFMIVTHFFKNIRQTEKIKKLKFTDPITNKEVICQIVGFN